MTTVVAFDTGNTGNTGGAAKGPAPVRDSGRAPVGTAFALTHLDALESEAVHIFREVAGEFERPVILFSGGK
ncbi:hypothetical protein ABZY33_35495, partial [Streptomyces sp. NPDC006552]